jgi:hypothetical protein
MDGIAGLCGLDRDYDNKACHYTLDTGKFREISATDDYCAYYLKKKRRQQCFEL